MPDRPLVSVESVSKHYPIDSGFFGRPGAVLKAVDRVDLGIGRGETVGLVGNRDRARPRWAAASCG